MFYFCLHRVFSVFLFLSSKFHLFPGRKLNCRVCHLELSDAHIETLWDALINNEQTEQQQQPHADLLFGWLSYYADKHQLTTTTTSEPDRHRLQQLQQQQKLQRFHVMSTRALSRLFVSRMCRLPLGRFTRLAMRLYQQLYTIYITEESSSSSSSSIVVERVKQDAIGLVLALAAHSAELSLPAIKFLEVHASNTPAALGYLITSPLRLMIDQLSAMVATERGDKRNRRGREALEAVERVLNVLHSQLRLVERRHSFALGTAW